VRVRVHARVCLRVRVRVRVRVHVHVRVRVSVHVGWCVRVRMCLCLYVCMCVRVCMCLGACESAELTLSSHVAMCVKNIQCDVLRQIKRKKSERARMRALVRSLCLCCACLCQSMLLWFDLEIQNSFPSGVAHIYTHTYARTHARTHTHTHTLTLTHTHTCTHEHTHTRTHVHIHNHLLCAVCLVHHIRACHDSFPHAVCGSCRVAWAYCVRCHSFSTYACAVTHPRLTSLMWAGRAVAAVEWRGLYVAQPMALPCCHLLQWSHTHTPTHPHTHTHLFSLSLSLTYKWVTSHVMAHIRNMLMCRECLPCLTYKCVLSKVYMSHVSYIN